MDLPSGPSPTVRTSVLLKLASEGFEDAFGAAPAWLEAPESEFDELRDLAGPVHFERLTSRTGQRPGERGRAGGPAGTVELTDAALEGALGLLGLAPLPPDVLVDERPDGPRYHVPDTWFAAAPADGSAYPFPDDTGRG